MSQQFLLIIFYEAISALKLYNEDQDFPRSISKLCKGYNLVLCDACARIHDLTSSVKIAYSSDSTTNKQNHQKTT